MRRTRVAVGQEAVDLENHLVHTSSSPSSRSRCSPPKLGRFPPSQGYDTATLNPGFTWAFISNVLDHAVLTALTIVLASVAGSAASSVRSFGVNAGLPAILPCVQVPKTLSP